MFWTAAGRDTAGIVRQNERIKEFSKEAEGRLKGAVQSRKGGTGKVSKSGTEQSELRVFFKFF